MTTREATCLLARSTGADVMDDYARSLSERAAVIAFGAIQWPWLLRSLHGGKLADKHALLDRLDLPYDALPYLGSWKADTGLLTLLVDHILEHKPRLVVEFGTGASTLVMARAMQDGRRRHPDQLRPAWRFRRRDPPVAERLRARSRSARGAARAVARRLAGPVVRSRAAALGHRPHADRRSALDDPSRSPGAPPRLCSTRSLRAARSCSTTPPVPASGSSRGAGASFVPTSASRSTRAAPRAP